jgi:hypothetical protein
MLTEAVPITTFPPPRSTSVVFRPVRNSVASLPEVFPLLKEGAGLVGLGVVQTR